MNRRRMAVFAAVSGDAAPKLLCTERIGREGTRYFGPLASAQQTRDAIKVLSDLLGLRDCADRMPMVFAEQGDLFAAPRQAACPRHDLGLCSGPCAGLVSAGDYRERVERAVAFLEGRAIAPVDRIVDSMLAASGRGDFETAARWRDRFEALEWLLGATTRARTAIELLSFVYRDSGLHGDDRAYLIRRGLVRASYPWPATPIEEEAFRAVVARELASAEEPRRLDPGSIEEMLLVMRWFRRHPAALRRTTPLGQWLDRTLQRTVHRFIGPRPEPGVRRVSPHPDRSS
jgi:excinuclease ABC subunit C